VTIRTSVGRDPRTVRSPRLDSGSAGTWIAECAAFGKGVTRLADLDYLIYYSGTYSWMMRRRLPDNNDGAHNYGERLFITLRLCPFAIGVMMLRIRHGGGC
jgi:hypothetical protein